MGPGVGGAGPVVGGFGLGAFPDGGLGAFPLGGLGGCGAWTTGAVVGPLGALVVRTAEGGGGALTDGFVGVLGAAAPPFCCGFGRDGTFGTVPGALVALGGFPGDAGPCCLFGPF